jgi:hypothetical protein
MGKAKVNVMKINVGRESLEKEKGGRIEGGGRGRQRGTCRRTRK